MALKAFKLPTSHSGAGWTVTRFIHSVNNSIDAKRDESCRCGSFSPMYSHISEGRR